MSASVLFDAPGPRARVWTLVGNIVGALVVLAVAAWVLLQLDSKGQLEPGLWADAVSARTWQYYLIPGLINTLRAAAFAIVGSIAFGLVFGLGRLSHLAVVRRVSGTVVEFLRAVPVLLMMVFFYGLFGQLLPGAQDKAFLAVVVALILYNGSVIAELVRSGVGNLPRGQGEAGLAIGLTEGQTLRSIQLPQALVAMLPAMVSQVVVVLKDSALGQLIGYQELLRTGQIVYSGDGNPLQVLTVVAVVFILLNLLLTVVAHRLSRLLSSRTSGSTAAGPGIGNPTVVAGTPATGGTAPV
ncbi:amino acid ABC transporter permease [Promicromonospora thailandica]|uniref:Glutamate transport system permease protein n=1 Tax=Promicromonospora thailandica TaxID=765201 RepID=A0A9X2JUV6_9MICO|nr:amino acid ABC transporter permease [Promicromonospora thailandica]MCP2263897.1 glutamate transport system permease protein [Promicromonospora thailandica]BFF17790.1 amino acid ABC transporter permease [Promicromonospora thailandica]